MIFFTRHSVSNRFTLLTSFVFYMSGVVGIDIGSADSIVAIVGKGMVDIVRNEVSERVTPSVVGFTHRNRLLGESAVSLIKSNYANTCRFPKLLIGKKLSDPDMEDEKFFQLCELKEAHDGSVGYAVSYMDQERVFSATEITAMLLTKLKDTTESFTGHPAKDAVIACPSYFTDIQRRALLDAAEIAGITPLRIMNDTAATALAYGIYRSNEFDETIPINVAFVSMGHSHFSCSIASFTRSQLTVLSEIADRTIGGRNLDKLLMEHFAGEFAAKNNGLNPLLNTRSRFKLEEAVTKMKKVLSANSEAAVNIECLLEERDISEVVKRPDLEAMCASMIPKIKEVIHSALAGAGMTPKDIAHVEILGGCSRIPFVQAATVEAFEGKELSRTLNADECVARGCALQAAILSPLFKVRHFDVIDYTHHPISISWANTTDASDMMDESEGAVVGNGSTKSVVVFPRKSPMNVVKVLTFNRTGPFDITAAYGDPQMLPAGTSPLIGKFHLDLPSSGEAMKVKVRAKLSLHGTFSVESAHLIETEEYDEIVKEKRQKDEKSAPADPENEPMTPADDTVEVVHKRKREKKTEIRVTATHTNGLSHQLLGDAIDAEAAMVAIDREARDRDVARNDLESYLYGAREKLSDVWAGFVPSEEFKEQILSEISAAEDWLYDKFEDGTKAEFADKLVEIQAKLAPVKNAHDEVIRKAEEEREAAIRAAAAAAAAAAEAAPAADDVNMETKETNPATVDEVD